MQSNFQLFSRSREEHLEVQNAHVMLLSYVKRLRGLSPRVRTLRFLGILKLQSCNDRILTKIISGIAISMKENTPLP